MLGVRRDDLVAGLQSERGDGDIAPVGRRARESNGLRRCADRTANRLARLATESAHLVPVRGAAAARLELSPVLQLDGLDRACRKRAEGSSVQVRHSLDNRKSGTDGGEIHGRIIAASSGA